VPQGVACREVACREVAEAGEDKMFSFDLKKNSRSFEKTPAVFNLFNLVVTL
jgi:hypothetical protein